MGAIQQRYRRRVAAIGTHSKVLKAAVAEILKSDLIDATNEQLYYKTPLPVTHHMLNSIDSKIVGESVSVGYTAKAEITGFKYVKRRLNMTGLSVYGGHVLDMDPNEYLRKHSDPKIKALVLAAKESAMEGV